ncbi:MAG: hypothetical protein MJE63_12365, partial [Proteobacteria bacterium]|nr:hypothetical protein [Pseudomonadota bacterium]
MAVGEFQVAVVNQSAHDIVSTCIQQGSQIPEIKYFIPALYEDGTVYIKDLDGKLTGVNDPSTAAITLNDANITPHLLQNAGSRYEGLIPPENVTRALSDGVTNPATLRIRISKEIDEHNIGGEANAFFICDENFAVWITIYITSHAFVAGQKWEIVTDAVFESSAPITSIPEDPNPFNYKVASEILLPGIIVGSSADAMSEKAGYNISEFQNVGLDISNKRTVFLKGVEALTANVVKNCDNLQLSMETTEAVLPLANHTLTLNGNNINGQLRVSGAADNSVVLTGSNYFLNILSDNDNCLDVTGAQ